MKKPECKLGILCVVSGPSGAGKTTLCRNLAADDANVAHSVSCTTRPPREGEVDGDDYYFLSVEEFERRVAEGEFLEHARVHDNFYGTLVASVRERLEQGADVVMDIDVQGAEQIRACMVPLIVECRVDVFIMPPDDDELRRRLANRGTESEEVFDLRMRNAVEEMEHWPKYQYLILSGTRDEDLARFKSIIESERMRVARLD